MRSKLDVQKWQSSLAFDLVTCSDLLIKGQVQGLGWFLTRFSLKISENNDVGKTVI